MARSRLICVSVTMVGLLLSTSLYGSDEQPRMRNWTDRTGQHETRAKFVDLQDGQVRLQKEDGTEIKVALETLSPKDHEYVAEVAGRSAKRSAGEWKSFRNRLTGEQQIGRVLQRTPVGGTRKLYAEDRKTGVKAWIWEPQWEISDLADPDAASPRLSTPESPPAVSPPNNGPPSSTGAMNLVPPALGALSAEVLVVGSGVDVSGAEKNALAQAIERTVGVMVDGETVVRNEEIVEEILTYTKGYIEGYEVLRTWDQDGVAHVEIAARVSVAKLGRKLKATAASEQQLNGRLMQVQMELEKEYERNACQMFRRAVADFTPEKMLRLAVRGDPQMDRTDFGAKLTVRYTATADLGAWESVHSGLKPFWKRISIAGTTLQVHSSGKHFFDSNLPVEPGASDYNHYSLYSNKSPEGSITYFDAYALPRWIEPEIKGLEARHAVYQVRIALLDQADRVVAEESANSPLLIVRWTGSRGQWVNSTIAPMPYSSPRYLETAELTQVFCLTLDQLGRVAKCVALWTRRP